MNRCASDFHGPIDRDKNILDVVSPHSIIRLDRTLGGILRYPHLPWVQSRADIHLVRIRRIVVSE